MSNSKNPLERDPRPYRFSSKTTAFLNMNSHMLEFLGILQEEFPVEDRLAAVQLDYSQLQEAIATFEYRLEIIIRDIMKMDLVDKATDQPIDWDFLIEEETPYKSRRQLLANIKNHNVEYNTLLNLRNLIVDEYRPKEEVNNA